MSPYFEPPSVRKAVAEKNLAETQAAIASFDARIENAEPLDVERLARRRAALVAQADEIQGRLDAALAELEPPEED